jgi:putative PIN family toxin of toxin-antitoxin system
LPAVLDPNVLISALISPRGAPARVLRAWLDGAFELVVSPLLLAELERALAYPQLRARIGADDAARVVDWLRRSAVVAEDQGGSPPVTSPDPGDDYVLALAVTERAALISGDRDVLSLGGELPIHSPAEFLQVIEPQS